MIGSSCLPVCALLTPSSCPLSRFVLAGLLAAPLLVARLLWILPGANESPREAGPSRLLSLLFPKRVEPGLGTTVAQ